MVFYAACYEAEPLRLLSLSYGVDAYLIETTERSSIVSDSIKPLVDAKILKEDSVVVVAKSSPGSPDGETNRLEINTVGALLR